VIGGQTFTAADFTNGTLGTVRPGDPVPFLLATEVEIEGGPGELVTIAVPNLPTNVVVEGLDANNQLQLDAAGKGVFLLRITGGNLQVDLNHLQIDVAVVPPQQQARSNWTRLAFASHVPSDPLRSSVEVTAATPLHKTATTAVGAPTARVVPRGFWHTMGDVAASFVGADPQTGWGVAASIAGGMLVIGDVGAVAKNLWRMDGGQWDEVNWVEFASSGFGVVTFWLGAGKAPIQRLIQRALLQNTTDSMAKVAAQSMRALAIGAGQSAASDLQGLWHLLTHCSSAGNRTLRQLVDDSRGMARQLAKVGSRRAAQHVDEYLQFLDQLGSVAGPAFNRGVVRLQGDAVDVVRAWLQTEPQAADKLRDIVAHAMADPRRRLRTERACWQHVGMLFANPQNLILRNGQRVFDAQMVDQLATLARSGTISHNSTLMRNLKNTGDGFPGFRWELDGLDEMLDAGRTVDTSATAIPRARTWHDQDLTDLDALSRLDDASASTRHLYYTEFRCGRHAVSGPAELDEKALAFMKHITTQPPSEPGWRVTHHIEFRLKNIGRQPATIDGWQRRLDRFVGNPDNLRLAGIDPSRAPRIQVDLIVRP